MDRVWIACGACSSEARCRFRGVAEPSSVETSESLLSLLLLLLSYYYYSLLKSVCEGTTLDFRTAGHTSSVSSRSVRDAPVCPRLACAVSKSEVRFSLSFRNVDIFSKYIQLQFQCRLQNRLYPKKGSFFAFLVYFFVVTTQSPEESQLQPQNAQSRRS